MKKKFKLTTETKVNFLGIKLFRIQATVSFKSIKKGDKGGWVESEDVYGNARVSGDAWVYGDAQVYGNARVSGDAWVYGDAQVYGDARVSGNARKKSPTQIQGTADFVNVCKKGYIKIGCIELSFKEWKSQYKKIGKQNGYTVKQVKEYGLYIDLIIELYK